MEVQARSKRTIKHVRREKHTPRKASEHLRA